MERNNLFEALANYDYEAMINLYASHSIDSLKSFSFMHDHRTRTSNNTNSSSTGISPEEKFDESLYLRQGGKEDAKCDTGDGSSLSNVTMTLNKLQTIVDHTSNRQSDIDVKTDSDIDVDVEMDKEQESSRNNGNLPYLPSLPMLSAQSTQISPSTPTRAVSSTEKAKKASLSMNLRNFRRHKHFNRLLPFESKRQKNGLQKMLIIEQEEIEQFQYDRARILSNSRPESYFTVHHRRSSCEKFDTFSSKKINDDENQTATIFDGAVANGTPVANTQIRGLGGGSGTIQHLACALDAPFGLALVLVMGADASSRHTAFRRLIIHEASCCDSPNCLRLLLEMGSSLMKSTAQTAQNDEGCMGCQDERYSACDSFRGYPVKRQKSDNCLLDLANSDSSGEKISFTSVLEFALELVKEVKTGKISEIDAARHLISKVPLSDTNKAAISLLTRVDQLQIKKPPAQPYRSFISYARVREPSVVLSNADGHGNTALHWAAFKNAASCVKILFEHKANPNAVAESTGWTPLHDAAYSDSAESIQILVKEGADVNSKAHSGATPLCFAAQEDSPNATRLLLESGADASIRCCESDTPTSGSENDNSQHFLLQQSRFSGYTPLHYCAHYNSHRAALVLLEYNTKMNKSGDLFEIQDLNNKLPIHVVAERGSSDVLKELLHNGVRVDRTGTQSNDTTAQDENEDMMSSNSIEEVNGTEQTNAVVPSSPNATQTAVITPISSPVLQSLIPSEPIRSSKPWNCLSQGAINECKKLLQEAELNWAPERNYVFTPNDRISIVEILKVGVRLNHIPQEIWLLVLQFCGRGWFEPNISSDGSIVCK